MLFGQCNDRGVLEFEDAVDVVEEGLVAELGLSAPAEELLLVGLGSRDSVVVIVEGGVVRAFLLL